MSSFEFKDGTLFISEELTRENAEALLKFFRDKSSSITANKKISIDLKSLTKIDSAGVAAIDQIIDILKKQNIQTKIVNEAKKIRDSLQTFSSLSYADDLNVKKLRIGYLERIGEHGFSVVDNIRYFIYLAADMLFWGVAGIFIHKGQRKGEFVVQSNLIGVNALPIVGLISFLVGFILSLQSGQQLREFGANIFIVDLIAISMTREMGPLMTAIILAGRSGSAIASEIATMRISEELDALKTMALNPIKYVVLPKLYAMTIATPLLTVFADIIGIAGGFLIGITYLKLSPTAFIDRMANVMVLKDIITSIVKSLVFAWLITIVGVYFGLRAKGGAGGVGKATTASVVTAIFMVIVADSVLGLLFY
ncbi:MAG TPA: MlaE family lipid ABC transporter permease subunit [Candidatus Cloacimonetes bacterium]|nr:MlaE family lipid ABC transporter permease subunit [Candidatus Cloacimonadota bacterium]